MGLKKVKYSQEEVDYLLNKCKLEYDSKLVEQKSINRELVEQLNSVKAELALLKDKESIILATLERAEKTAIELERTANEQYELELERLKRFVSRWNAYFKSLKDEYPESSAIRKAINIKEMVEAASIPQGAKKLIMGIDSVIDDKEQEKFNPKEKIHEYIAATGDNGFNLDEVLNPGKLQLEDLCKELGLMGGNE
ncbi:MAG: hypothetical protein IKB67_00555 [Clostridia bacterium]|nr:hypothetical protein [Clostridia bacterium]